MSTKPLISPDFFIIEHGSAWYALSVVLRHEVLRKPLNLHYTASQLSAEQHDFHLVYAENETVMAILLLSPIDAQTVKMRQVAVHPDLQRKGIGKKLVAFAEQVAIDKGYKLIVLHARETAVDFYLALHYQMEHKMFYEVGIPHFKFTKALQ